MAIRLERERQTRGMGKVEFSRFLGVAESVYYEILDGTGNPTIMSVTRIARATGMPLWVLFSKPDDEAEIL